MVAKRHDRFRANPNERRDSRVEVSRVVRTHFFFLVDKMLTSEWPTDKILQYIQEYKNRPVLWDRDHRHYRIADRKMKAWEEMAGIFKTDTWELKKKMNSLLASYRRERYKVRTKTGKPGEQYVSTWFAYRSFGFLQDKYIERQNRYTPQDDHDDGTDLETETQLDYVKSENVDESVYHEEDLTLLNGIEDQETDDCPQPRKRHKPDDDTSRRSETSTNHQRDDSEVFGEYISGKMRNFDHKTKCIVQYLVSNILFQADMGKFKEEGFDYENLMGSLMFKNASGNSDSN